MSEPEFQINEQEFQDFQALMQSLETAETDDFLELATLLGRNPKTDLIGADLSGTDLRGKELIDANLNGVNLSRADLSNANLSNANLSGADLREANLYGSNLSGANLDGATVHGTQFGSNLGLSEATELNLKSRGALFNNSMISSSSFAEEALLETRVFKQGVKDSIPQAVREREISQLVEQRETSPDQKSATTKTGMNLDFFQPKTIRHLPQRVAAKLEAADNGGLRVAYGGTSWRFKLLVAIGQIIQLLPGQTVTIVGIEDTSTLIVEVDGNDLGDGENSSG